MPGPGPATPRPLVPQAGQGGPSPEGRSRGHRGRETGRSGRAGQRVGGTPSGRGSPGFHARLSRTPRASPPPPLLPSPHPALLLPGALHGFVLLPGLVTRGDRCISRSSDAPECFGGDRLPACAWFGGRARALGPHVLGLPGLPPPPPPLSPEMHLPLLGSSGNCQGPRLQRLWTPPPPEVVATAAALLPPAEDHKALGRGKSSCSLKMLLPPSHFYFFPKAMIQCSPHPLGAVNQQLETSSLPHQNLQFSVLSTLKCRDTQQVIKPKT